MRYIAFLRAINVGGHTVKMDRLRDLFVELGFTGVETYIASGNVIFETRAKDPAKLEAKIEKALHAVLGFEVAAFLRTPAELEALTQHPAFPEAELAQAGAYCVGMLKAPLTKEQQKTLKGLETEQDSFALNGKEIYWLCQVRQSESKFSNNLFERKVGVVSTFRGISTLQKMVKKYPAG